MTQSRHHGQHSFENKNKLCTMESYEYESIGRFGRMFRQLPPLYVNPNYLSGMGSVGGPMDGGMVPQFTNSVPLGMIFLGQFIDHDITFDTQSNFNNINNPIDITNTRSASLDLDCVFGGGPEDEPFMYAKRSEGFYLLTGKTNNNIGQGQEKEKQDLPRSGKGVAIIGDPRNDENRVISQLQLAMIRFYNAVYHEIATSPAGAGLQAEEIYKEARKQVTWHYQWIVINEFLPTLCGPNMVSDILGNGRKFYCPQHGAFIPVEFSVAAYRFGHSMINQNLNLKIGGASHSIFSPEFGQGFTKIMNLDQVIDWETLFDFDGTHQKSEKLDTGLASILLHLPFIPDTSTNPQVNADNKSLAIRNLRRGQSFLLPSGENVARCMGIAENEITDLKNYIQTKMNPNNIDLSSGTPLWFYILAEAELIGRGNKDGTSTPGEGLGPVGGRIVAEVLIGLIELDPNSYLGNNRDWTPGLANNRNYTMKDLLTLSKTAIEL